jgi:CHAT domain-containing protein
MPALPHVAGESAAIHALWGGRLLLDDDFTSDAVRRTFVDESWSIVHLASHTELAGSATASRLQLGDGTLDVDQLAALVAATRFRSRPLELLSLSACSTAADTRSGLGLAGIAVRSGASSVLGTLWNVQDDAAAELVVAFHRALQSGGVSRADALRNAQRSLLERAETAHPGYWAAFVLVGSWL